MDGQPVPGLPDVTFQTSWTTTISEGCDNVTPVPEFGTVTAGLALIGSMGAYFGLKKKQFFIKRQKK